jgi:PhnB protein
MAVKPVPDGSHTVTPPLMVKCAARLIEFLKEACRGEEAFSMPLPSGEIQHAEVKIGDAVVMLHPAMHQPPTTTSLFLSVHDADAVYRRALKAGAISVAEPMDRF